MEGEFSSKVKIYAILRISNRCASCRKGQRTFKHIWLPQHTRPITSAAKRAKILATARLLITFDRTPFVLSKTVRIFGQILT